MGNIFGKNIFIDNQNSISLFLKLKNKFNDVSILESVIGGDNKGRYTIIFFNKKEDIKIYEDYSLINKKKKKINNHKKFIEKIYNEYQLKVKYKENIPLPIIIGNICFDICKFSLPKLKYNKNKSLIKIPLAHFVKPKNLIIIDNIVNQIHIIDISSNKKQSFKEIDSIVKIIKSINTKKVKRIDNKFNKKFINLTKKSSFLKNVNKIKKEISNGEIFQAVLSQRFENEYKIDPFNFYRALRSLNPSPYLVYLNFHEYQIICSSPETMIKVNDGLVTLRPIAGTRKRGKNKFEDEKYKKDLLKDKKELAEHLMLVDLGRNDVGTISKIGTVRVTEKNIIEYYSHVMHIVSNVIGKLKNTYNPVDVLFAGLPAGTVSGAPKIRALQILEDLEDINREFYAGSVCYFDANGNMDSCINLRTALIKNNKIYAQSGAGIVYDSIDEREYEECINKANALFQAYSIAHNIK
ncbi:MAG: anthranilate synthase component I [Pelagibacteraceae bacterium]|nr:anthranilate synthase component I [Pelagibacteraceae bacterium]